jgi:hypothetical protein
LASVFKKVDKALASRSTGAAIFFQAREIVEALSFATTPRDLFFPFCVLAHPRAQ